MFQNITALHIPGNVELHMDIFGECVRNAGKPPKVQPEIKKPYYKFDAIMALKGKVWIKELKRCICTRGVIADIILGPKRTTVLSTTGVWPFKAQVFPEWKSHLTPDIS